MRGTFGRRATDARDAAYISARTAALFGRFRRNRGGDSGAERALAASDLIVERGGPFFAATGPPPNTSLMRYAWPMVFAREHDIPYAFVGESVSALDTAWSRWFVTKLLDDAELVGVRDPLSKANLTDAGVPAAHVATMLDNAFWVEPSYTDRVDDVLRRHDLHRRAFLAVTCKELGPVRNGPYVDALACCIDELVPGNFERVALVPNTWSPYGVDKDDRAVTMRVRDRLRRPDLAVLVDEDLGPDELAALYGRAAVVLGTRLHSVILALVGGAPVVAMSYEPVKTHGVMALLGLGDFVVDLEALDPTTVTRLARDASAAQVGIPRRIAALRTEGDAIVQRLVETVDARR
jgi:colanic acid/amylovoran biosynthesis protein